jgi:hypothetical protein
LVSRDDGNEGVAGAARALNTADPFGEPLFCFPE